MRTRTRRRASWWDYRNSAAYFVTICTKNRINFFGEIISQKGKIDFKLTDIGEIAYQYFEEIPNHIENVQIDNFVIMPNHVHGIIIITENLEKNGGEPNGSLVQRKGKIIPVKGELGVIIRSYKSAVTRESRMLNPFFGWQANYHDRIIRDASEYDRIDKYITNNPANWGNDKFYKK